jgi:glycosyltransferase involved in cell wall biosynthesis
MSDENKKYRVLRIIPSLNPCKGGVVTSVLQSLEFNSNVTNNASIEFTALCFDNEDDEWIVNFNSEFIVCLGRGKFKFSYNKMYMKWIENNAKEFDLIILDGLWQYHNLATTILLRKKIPYMYFVHGMLDSYFNSFILKKIKKNLFWFLFLKKSINKADKVIFTSEEELESSINSFPSFNPNVLFSKLGVAKPDLFADENNNYFLPLLNDLGLNVNDCNIGMYLSRIHKKKGIFELLNLILKNKNFFLQKKCHFVIAGSGDKEDIRKVEFFIVNHDLSDIVTYIGPIYGTEKWRALQSANFTILPTHQENFGFVLVESLAMGTPVITTNKTHLWKVLESECVGIISEDNEMEIFDAIKFWLDSSKEYKIKLSINAIDMYLREYDFRITMRGFCQNLEFILDKINNK